MRQKVHIRVDGNEQIGHGHVIRCLALAQMLSNEYDCGFYSLMLNEGLQKNIIQEGFNCHALEKEADFLDQLSTGNFVVIDGYHFSNDYYRKLKHKGAIVCVIDDAMMGTYAADCLINHAPNADAAHFQINPNGLFALGLDYSLLRKHYQINARNSVSSGDVNSLFICFGGADPKALTIRALTVLLAGTYFQQYVVVIGSSFQHKEDLLELLRHHSTIELHESVSEIEMIQLMQRCASALVPCSGMLLEALALQRSVIAGFYIENQEQLYQQFNELDAFTDAGSFELTQLESAFHQHVQLQKSTKRWIDGYAPVRFQNLFSKLQARSQVYVRKALPKDVQQTYLWATDPVIRAFSFSHALIQQEEHEAWFGKKLLDPACYYYIAEENEQVIGSIRFDCSDESAVISYLVDSAFHGKGWGTKILAMGIEKLRNDKSFQLRKIEGKVMISNIPSVKSFEKLNFEKTELEGVFTFSLVV